MISQDEDRMVKLEDELKAVRTKAEEADKAYDEVFKKIQVENDFEKNYKDLNLNFNHPI